MWQKLKRGILSFRFKIITGISVILVVLMTFSVLFFLYTFSDYLEKQALQNFSALITQTNGAVEDSFSIIESTIENFYSNQTLQEWLERYPNDTSTKSEQIISQVKLDEALKHSLMVNSAWQNDLIDTVYFFLNPTCFSFYSRGNYSIQEISDRNFEIMNEMDAHPSEKLHCFPPSADQSIFYLSKSYFAGENNELHMKLVLSADEETLCNRYSAILQYPGMTACLMDADGTIYSSPDKALLGTKAEKVYIDLLSVGTLKEVDIEGQESYAASHTDKKSGLTFLVTVPRDQILSATQVIAYRYVHIMLMVFGVLFLLSITAAYWGTRFVKELTLGISRVKKGDYTAKMPNYSSTELKEMSTIFNEMTAKIDYLVHKVYEKQLAVNQADIRYLQSQINPHFLFNALAAISTKAKMAHEETIYRMITSLSTLLQASFHVDNEGMTTVREELDCVRCYLYIQKMRFGDKLKYEIQLQDDSLLDLAIPRLCIEPLVENAIVHGIEGKRGGGTVWVRAYCQQEHLCFEISDNGTGFPAGNTDINAMPQETGKGFGIGLKNTDRRLKLLYGDAYGVHIEPGRTQGACVRVLIPLSGKENSNV